MYIHPSLEFDTSNFDKTFLVMDTNLKRESVNTGENTNHKDKYGPPALDETAFAVYNFGESEMTSSPISERSDTEKSETCSGSGEKDVLSDNCQTKSEDEGDVASGSDSVSVSVSDFGSEHGLGAAVTERAVAEDDDNDSTLGTIDNQQQETSTGRASEEMSSAVLERIKTLASQPGVKASARHSRDLSRVSVDLENRHSHLEAGERRSADEWTILEAEPEGQATNGRKVSDTLFAKGVVDKYRLALRKRRETSKISRQPSWRSPSASLIIGRSGSGNNVRDAEKAAGGFLTPLSPTLAGIKSKFKSRNRSNQRFTVEPTSPKAGALLGRNLQLASNESTQHQTGGMLSAPYPTVLAPMSKEGSASEIEGTGSADGTLDDA
ncbi:hypothetical protein QFC22_003420 [Naganishia vaughanmartiniae]|uniref:Uncharacterized protein n=1 Tax=Naganishia vaughanmartiniae TaxID=1424756 RepID=A0ACC2X6M2_9TREE|nr:hypothetical protein QFC22_003420 [Naganishia vaughanmartiniae]